MAIERSAPQRAPVQKMGGSSSLAEVLNVILDKGIVIDAWARISVIGIEILTIEARVVVASVETYLRYAEAIGLTQLAASPPNQQAASGQQGSQQSNGRNGNRKVSDREVIGYIEDHPDGTRLGEMEAYFDAPREELQGVMNDLVRENKVRRDDEQKRYYPAEGE